MDFGQLGGPLGCQHFVNNLLDGALFEAGGIATLEKIHRFLERGAVWQAFDGGNVFQHSHIQRHVQGAQMGHRLHVNGPIGGREPKNVILAVGQLCGHQFSLALGFAQVGEAHFLALAAVVINQGEFNDRQVAGQLPPARQCRCCLLTGSARAWSCCSPSLTRSTRRSRSSGSTYPGSEARRCRQAHTGSPACRLIGGMLTELGYDRVDVLGISWGGGVAQQFALSERSRCRRLVLVSTGTGALMVPASRPCLLAC